MALIWSVITLTDTPSGNTVEGGDVALEDRGPWMTTASGVWTSDGYSTNQVEHSQALVALAGSTKPKTQVGDNGCGYQLSLLGQSAASSSKRRSQMMRRKWWSRCLRSTLFQIREKIKCCRKPWIWWFGAQSGNKHFNSSSLFYVQVWAQCWCLYGGDDSSETLNWIYLHFKKIVGLTFWGGGGLNEIILVNKEQNYHNLHKFCCTHSLVEAI